MQIRKGPEAPENTPTPAPISEGGGGGGVTDIRPSDDHGASVHSQNPSEKSENSSSGPWRAPSGGGGGQLSVQEQHACLDLAKHRRWDELEAMLRASPHPRCLINSQPSGRWPALHQVLARTCASKSLAACFPAVFPRREGGGESAAAQGRQSVF